MRAALFIDQLAERRPVAVVVAGDMDARPDSASMRFWTGRQSLAGNSVAYQDAWEFSNPSDPGLTFTTDNPLVTSDWRRISGRRIDYILLRCPNHAPAAATIASCRRLFDEPTHGTWASDHFGLTCDLSAAAPDLPS
nr:endonuclease/exonuclease/phosphatase family protein [Jiangella endophytica]